MKTEKEWVTKAGLKASVVATDMGHRCGYVGVQPSHKLYGKDYGDVEADPHGGLTYAEERDGLWWFGFDCAHWNDAKNPEMMSAGYREAFDRHPVNTHGTVKTLEFCISECESLAKQLGALNE